MIVIKRNQIIVTALFIMVAIAGYLNYSDKKNELEVTSTSANINNQLTGALAPTDFEYEEFAGIDILNGEISISTGDEELTAVTDVSNLELDGIESVQEKTNVGEAVFVSSSLDNTYFIQARLDREQSRAKQKDVLTEMINNTSIEEEQRAECADAMLEIQERIEKETATESMIKSKGFGEVYVRIDDNTVDVVIDKAELTQAEVAQIEDIVVRKTGMSIEKIRISPLKK